MALTHRQQRFVDEYLIDLNATQAAIRAGYSRNTANREGSRLLSKVDIAQAIAAKAAKHASAVDLTAERVLKGLYEEATRTGDGASHGARVSAWGLLGKYHGLFTEKIEASITADITVTDARGQLESLLARHLAAGSGTKGA